MHRSVSKTEGTSETEAKLVELMADLFRLGRDEITDSLTMKSSAAWDSLKHMELVVGIEESFGIELVADEIVAMQTVSEIKRILKDRGIEA